MFAELREFIERTRASFFCSQLAQSNCILSTPTLHQDSVLHKPVCYFGKSSDHAICVRIMCLYYACACFRLPVASDIRKLAVRCTCESIWLSSVIYPSDDIVLFVNFEMIDYSPLSPLSSIPFLCCISRSPPSPLSRSVLSSNLFSPAPFYADRMKNAPL